jgi:hypothetical protein
VVSNIATNHMTTHVLSVHARRLCMKTRGGNARRRMQGAWGHNLHHKSLQLQTQACGSVS